MQDVQVDMSVNGLRALPRTLVRRRIEERAADLTFSRGLHRVLAVEHIATWEFGVAVGALEVAAAAAAE